MIPFEEFVDYYSNYPDQSPFSKLVAPLPTNSWMENAIVSNVAEGNCFFNVIPWTWVALYETAMISLDHLTYVDSFSNLTQGNLAQIYGRGNAIVVHESSHSPYSLTSVTDMCSNFSSERMSAYPSRGSVLQSFTFNAADVIVDFTEGSVSQVSSVGNKTTLTYDRMKNSFGTSAAYNTSVSSNGQLTVRGWFYRDFVRYEENGFDTKISFTSSRGASDGATTLSSVSLTLVILEGTYVLSSNNTEGTFSSTSSGVGVVTGTASNTDTQATITFAENGEVFKVRVQYDSGGNVGLVTTTYSRPLSQKLVIYGPPMSLQGNSLTSPNYTGVMQIANVDDWGPNLESFFGQYFTSGDVKDYEYNDPGVTYAVFYSPQSAQQPTLLPNHWNGYDMMGGFSVSTLSVANMIYGNIYPYVLSSTVVLSTALTIPDLTTVVSMPSSISSLLREEIRTATLFLPEFDVYAFGQSSFALVRLLTYARTNEVSIPDSDELVVSAKTKLLTFLGKWLGNNNNVTSPSSCQQSPGYPNNSVMHHFQHESKWGGIVLPADYLNINRSCYYNQSDYGNSYYNDHHFHWGYLFYTINALMFLYNDTGLENYKDAITSLLMDVVNPAAVTFAKTRYKDWYGGHSLATGFEPTPVIDRNGNYVGPLLSPMSGPIQRQQESCSEAIHCYYSAYLLAKRFGLAEMSRTSAVCLSTEIDAINNYYYMSAYGSNAGVLGAGVGILFTDSKQITLDWAPQPDSHNGRMCGIYGIQSLPFTEMSYAQIKPDWVTKCATYPVSSFVTDEALCLSLIRENYAAELYTNEVVLAPYNSKGGLQWGAVASKILCFGPPELLTNQGAQEIYQSLRNDRIYDLINQAYLPPLLLQFDSVTHTYYFMFRAGKVTSFNSETFPSVEQTLPFPTPTYKELLATSSLRDQCLIEVPLLRAGSKLSVNNTQVEEIYYQVIDTQEYSRGKTSGPNECCKGVPCKVNGATKCQIVVTNLSTSLNPISVVDAPGVTFQDKSNNLQGSTSELLLSYSILKLGLARLLYGDFDLVYLTRRRNRQFLEDLASSRFCSFVKVLAQNFPGYERFFIY